MQWADSPIIDEIAALQLPDPSAVIVCAGSALELYGIRSAADIDLIVSDQNFGYLRDRGWTEEVRGHSDPLMSEVTALTDPTGRFDVWSQWYDGSLAEGKRNVPYPQVLKHSVRHTAGFYVVSLEYLLHLKQAQAREKDIEDIKYIQNRLAQA